MSDPIFTIPLNIYCWIIFGIASNATFLHWQTRYSPPPPFPCARLSFKNNSGSCLATSTAMHICADFLISWKWHDDLPCQKTTQFVPTISRKVGQVSGMVSIESLIDSKIMANFVDLYYIILYLLSHSIFTFGSYTDYPSNIEWNSRKKIWVTYNAV